MRSVKEELPNLKRLIKMLAMQYGDNTEVLLLDMSNDYKVTIIATENGHITGQSIGKKIASIAFEGISQHKDEETGDIYNFFTHTKNDKLIRSSVFFLRNDEDDIVGGICINTDISSFLHLQDSLHQLTMYTPDKQIHEVFASSVTDLGFHLVEEAKEIIDKPGKDMTRDEKMKVLRYLDDKEFFLITKSGDIACEFLDISKYTLYKYLNDIR